MPKTVDHEQIRNTLIEGAIRAGAKFGIGGITNQLIAEESGQKEAYIYRYFIDRDDLVQKAFFNSDRNFFRMLSEKATIFQEPGLSQKEKLYAFLNCIWDYSAANTDDCKFYLRFYYSVGSNDELWEEHSRICAQFFKTIDGYLDAGENRKFILHTAFMMILSALVDIASGFEKDSPENRKRIFEILCQIVLPYLKEPA